MIPKPKMIYRVEIFEGERLVGEKYVKLLEDIIVNNSLTDFDKATLLPTKLKKGGIDPIYIGLSVITLLSIVKIAFNDGVDWGEDIRRSVVFRLDAIYFGLIAYLIKDKIKIKFLIFVSITSSIFLIIVGINPKTLSESILLQNLFLPICSLFFGSILIILTLIRFESKKIISISNIIKRRNIIIDYSVLGL